MAEAAATPGTGDLLPVLAPGAASLPAGPLPSPTHLGPVTLPGTEEWHLDTGAGPYRLFLALPDAPPPPEGFPVLTVLDANASFATVAEAVRRAAHRPGATGARPLAVLGIGYPGDNSDSQARRRIDYTPGPSSEGENGACGGSARFLQLIRDEIRPLLRSRLPVDEARHALLGHSLGGYFVLDALLHAPGLFRDHVAISPSIWWDRPRLERGIAVLADRRSAPPPGPGSAATLPPQAFQPSSVPPRLALAIGAWEQSLAPWQRNRPDSAAAAERRGRRAMVDNARDLAALFAAALPDGAVRFDLLPDEDHASAFSVALNRALRFLSN